MKKAGIIGGIGPASTLDYYKDIIDGYRSKIQKDDYPELIIESINMSKLLGFIADEQTDNLIDYLASSVKNLSNAGANFAAIASNTPHIVFDEVQERSTIPLISIIEETCKYTKEIGCERVVVLGTKFTMNSGLYTKAFKRFGINAFVPDESGQNTIHGIIFPNLENGIIVQEEQEKMLIIAQELIKVHNAEAIVLGCTELPLMIKNHDIETTIINTTKIHVESIINKLMT